jgi:adenylylsulfate kinase
MGQAGLIVLASFIAPFEADRRAARRIVSEQMSPLPFIEVFVSTPLHVCEQRDPKGLYARARAGILTHFTGISAPFEVPTHPAISIDTSEVSVGHAVASIVACIDSYVVLPGDRCAR